VLLGNRYIFYAKFSIYETTTQSYKLIQLNLTACQRDDEYHDDERKADGNNNCILPEFKEITTLLCTHFGLCKE